MQSDQGKPAASRVDKRLAILEKSMAVILMLLSFSLTWLCYRLVKAETMVDTAFPTMPASLPKLSQTTPDLINMKEYAIGAILRSETMAYLVLVAFLLQFAAPYFAVHLRRSANKLR